MTKLLKRLLWAMWRPLFKQGLRWLPLEDPWKRFPHRIPVSRFGSGSTREFGWYFEGRSQVEVHNLADLCEWLLACQYAHDQEVFNESDFWQHPTTFEYLRRGDCEDHALWAWRKLVELGYEAELVSGRCRRPDGSFGAHVWVRFRQDGQDFLLEAVAKNYEAMVRPLEKSQDDYWPHHSVTGKFQRYSYHGFLHSMKLDLLGPVRRADSAAPVA
jgi:hypothetical protein